jgi:hypothetical protein
MPPVSGHITYVLEHTAAGPSVTPSLVVQQ